MSRRKETGFPDQSESLGVQKRPVPRGVASFPAGVPENQPRWVCGKRVSERVRPGGKGGRVEAEGVRELRPNSASVVAFSENNQ